MKKSLALVAAVLLLSGLGLSKAWAGHFIDVLPPASPQGAQPVSNGYDWNLTSDSGAPPFTLPSRTLAQLQTLTPPTTGQMVYCSNCVQTNVCISSGSTAAYQWVAISSTGTLFNAGQCK